MPRLSGAVSCPLCRGYFWLQIVVLFITVDSNFWLILVTEAGSRGVVTSSEKGMKLDAEMPNTSYCKQRKPNSSPTLLLIFYMYYYIFLMKLLFLSWFYRWENEIICVKLLYKWKAWIYNLIHKIIKNNVYLFSLKWDVHQKKSENIKS